MWAYLAIYSRAFHIVKDENPVMAMVPLADITNHHYNAALTSKKFDSEKRTFKISSTKECPSGEEVFLLYGPLDNSELLLFFGFALPDNPYDTVKIELDVLDEEEYTTSLKKMLFFASAEGFMLSHDLKMVDGKVVHRELMGSLRLLWMTPEEIEGYSLENVDEICDKVISVENEKQAISTLTSVLDYMLSMYPTTWEEDKVALAAGLPDWKVYCYHYRMGQKAIMETAKKELNEKLANL
eukprot:TRINITY_DN4433_c0_g1_i3.p1 TRINITY_DN4433_c0_g1~~TRINITY_DN4433_c0_g1_i3.p1  ORF type:complete len:240 (-),score=61.96 TRINITY_DN4433_c0_g1_i3:39-758(-)